MKKKVILVLEIFFMLIFIVYLFMLMDTNNVMDEARAVFMDEVDDKLISTALLEKYSNEGRLSKLTSPKIDLKLLRLFTIHNFYDGYIWVWYNYEVRDGNNNLVRGSWNIKSKWTIHKENSKWRVVSIDERP